MVRLNVVILIFFSQNRADICNASTSLLVFLFFSLFSSSSPLLMVKIVGAMDPALDENYTLGHVASIKNVQTTYHC